MVAGQLIIAFKLNPLRENPCEKLWYNSRYQSR